ncbi:MAG: CPBP family intramembrane glutamic endopeptidase [Candidatus Thorarchaeota archaeon]
MQNHYVSQRSAKRPMTTGNVSPFRTLSTRQTRLILMPILLIPSEILVFSVSMDLFGRAIGYLVGFLSYWIVWCGLFPVLMIGKAEVAGLFRKSEPQFGNPTWLGIVLVSLPAVSSFVFNPFFMQIQEASLTVLIISILFAVANATSEEILWRGVYAHEFQESRVYGFVLPSIGFGFWHLAPQIVFPSSNPVLFSLFAISLGLPFGYVAFKTKSIRWLVLSHIILDFSGLAGFKFI